MNVNCSRRKCSVCSRSGKKVQLWHDYVALKKTTMSQACCYQWALLCDHEQHQAQVWSFIFEHFKCQIFNNGLSLLVWYWLVLDKEESPGFYGRSHSDSHQHRLREKKNVQIENQFNCACPLQDITDILLTGYKLPRGRKLWCTVWRSRKTGGGLQTVKGKMEVFEGMAFLRTTFLILQIPRLP